MNSRRVHRVLVLWADHQSGNFGVRVLAEGMADLARAAWGAGVDVDWQNFGAGDSCASFGIRSIARDIGRKNGPIKKKLREYDVVLDSGAGDSFTDIYGLKRLACMIYAQRAAFKLGIPVVVGPQTIGPFDTVLGRLAARRSLRMVDTVIARDTRSADFARTLGRKVEAISTDVVFALPDPEQGQPRDIVLNISGLLWFEDRHVNSARYRDETFQLVEALQEQGRHVSLLAHVVAPGYDEDDVYAIQEFQREYGVELETIVPTTLKQVRSIVASTNLVIGSRMHACLNALSCGTPAIAWAYSRKFAPLMHDIGWEYVFDLADPATSPAAQTLHVIAAMSSGEFEGKASAVRIRAQERLNAAVLALRGVDVRKGHWSATA